MLCVLFMPASLRKVLVMRNCKDLQMHNVAYRLCSSMAHSVHELSVSGNLSSIDLCEQDAGLRGKDCT